MNLVIDEFNSNTGFIAYGNAQIYSENELSQYVAGPDNTKSVLFEFQENGDYIEKTGLNIDVTDYDYIICNFYSQKNKLAGARGNNYNDYVYKISFNNSIGDFFVTLYETLSPVVFQIISLDTIEQIKIEYIGNKLDRLSISHCLAVKDELPIDIFKSTQQLVLKEIENKLGDGVILGQATTNTGDREISLTGINYENLSYIDRYSVILITDGVNSEIHTLSDNDENFFKFEKDNDGEAIQNNFIDADVYLIIPVRFGIKEIEYNVPSIAITGYDPEPILRGGKIEQIKNSPQIGKTDYIRFDDQIQKHYIQIACIARMETNIMSFMSQVIRDVIAREILWINGWRFDIYFDGRPEFIEFSEAENPITGLVYTLVLEVKEEVWRNLKLPQTQTRNLTVKIQG